MTRPLPVCAFCGESLVRAGETAAGRVLIEFRQRRRPIVGWHGGCARRDGAYQRLRGSSEALVEVLARGQDRVSLTASTRRAS